MTTATASPITISNRIPTSTSAATLRKQVLGGKILFGCNVTDGACAPTDPVKAASQLASYGVNYVRLHHVDRGLLEGWWTIDGILKFCDALYASGIRFSVDGCSKLGEKWTDGNDAFKRSVYDGDEAAISLYKSNIERIKPILAHRGCFLACLVNEAAHVTTPDKALAFWQTWSPVFRSINPNLILSDCPDAWAKGISNDMKFEWVETSKAYDLLLAHFYVDDGNADGTSAWASQFWHMGNLTWFAAMTGKKVLIQEFGSYKSNPNQGANTFFLRSQAQMRGFSTCEFSYASNEEGWSGGGGDVFTICNDPLRLKMLAMGGLMAKTSGISSTWHEGQDQGAEFSVSGRVVGNQDYCQIGSYIWGLDKSRPWFWLVKGL